MLFKIFKKMKLSIGQSLPRKEKKTNPEILACLITKPIIKHMRKRFRGATESEHKKLLIEIFKRIWSRNSVGVRKPITNWCKCKKDDEGRAGLKGWMNYWCWCSLQIRSGRSSHSGHSLQSEECCQTKLPTEEVLGKEKINNLWQMTIPDGIHTELQESKHDLFF